MSYCKICNRSTNIRSDFCWELWTKITNFAQSCCTYFIKIESIEKYVYLKF